jgi:hypothetical protein
MVTIRFKPMEIQEILLWGKEYREKQEDVGMHWDDDQQKIIEKLRSKPESGENNIQER